MRLVLCKLAALVLLFPAIARADGQALALNCYTCHTATRAGESAIPSLAKKNAAEIAQRLHDFKSERAPSTLMARIAKAYSDAEITAIADYLATRR
jgi:sulfide dehydrogenase cytochrome subunit